MTGLAYCGCCKREYPAHEAEAGICMDCNDSCWVGDCTISGEPQAWVTS
jgi:hypothetical protein